MAGCPKCCRDLVLANPHKETVVHPNGFISFKELRVGEKLTLPEKWFEPRFELLPPAYFGSLPYADGVTPSHFGEAAAGILRDFKALDVAADRLRALAEAESHMDDEAFANDVSNVAAAIDAAVQPAVGSSNEDAAKSAWVAREGTYSATHLKLPRASVQNVLTLALESAQHALKELYGSVQPPPH